MSEETWLRLLSPSGRLYIAAWLLFVSSPEARGSVSPCEAAFLFDEEVLTRARDDMAYLEPALFSSADAISSSSSSDDELLESYCIVCRDTDGETYSDDL